MRTLTLQLPTIATENPRDISPKSNQKRMLVVDPFRQKFIYSSYTSGYIRDTNSVSHIKLQGDLVSRGETRPKALQVTDLGDVEYPIQSGKYSVAVDNDSLLYSTRCGMNFVLNDHNNTTVTTVDNIETYILQNDVGVIHDIDTARLYKYAETINYPVTLVSAFKLMAFLIQEAVNTILPFNLTLHISNDGINLRKDKYICMLEKGENIPMISSRLSYITACMEELRGFLMHHGMRRFWLRIIINPIHSNILFCPTDRHQKYATSFNITSLQNKILDGPDPYDLFSYNGQSVLGDGITHSILGIPGLGKYNTYY